MQVSHVSELDLITVKTPKENDLTGVVTHRIKAPIYSDSVASGCIVGMLAGFVSMFAAPALTIPGISNGLETIALASLCIPAALFAYRDTQDSFVKGAVELGFGRGTTKKTRRGKAIKRTLFKTIKEIPVDEGNFTEGPDEVISARMVKTWISTWIEIEVIENHGPAWDKHAEIIKEAYAIEVSKTKELS